MIKAYVLGNVNPNCEKKIATCIKKISCIKEIDLSFGKYDFIATVEAEDEAQLNNVVFDAIRKLPDVTSTLTLITYKLP